MNEREYVWQYMRRYDGRPFGSPRSMTTTDIEERMERFPVLIAYNTETGDVIW